MVRTTRIFRNGNSLAVRLPADFNQKPGLITITREPGAIIIRVAPCEPADLAALIAEAIPGRFHMLPSDPAPFDRPRT